MSAMVQNFILQDKEFVARAMEAADKRLQLYRDTRQGWYSAHRDRSFWRSWRLRDLA